MSIVEGEPTEAPKPAQVIKINKVGSELWQPPTFDVWLREVIDDRRWIIPGFLPEDGLVLLSGQKKRAMKTFFALTQMFCLATGKSTSLFKVPEAMPVLFIEEEGGRAETRERCLGIMKTLGISSESEDLRNIYFAHRVRTKLDDPNWRRSLVALVKRHKIKVVYLDALVYMHSGDENKVPDMQPVVETLQALRAAGATVVYLAHLDKSRGEDKKADIDTQVRGTGILTDAYDLHIALRRYKAAEANILLTVRGRSSEERHYSVAWLIESHTEGERDIIDQAKLSIIERVEDDGDVTDLAKRCLAKTDLGVEYSQAELRVLWDLGGRTAKDVMELLCKQKNLTKEENNYIRYS